MIREFKTRTGAIYCDTDKQLEYLYVGDYGKAHTDRQHMDLQRWCNNRFVFAKCPRFEDYNKTIINEKQLQLDL